MYKLLVNELKTENQDLKQMTLSQSG